MGYIYAGLCGLHAVSVLTNCSPSGLLFLFVWSFGALISLYVRLLLVACLSVLMSSWNILYPWDYGCLLIAACFEDSASLSGFLQCAIFEVWFLLWIGSLCIDRTWFLFAFLLQILVFWRGYKTSTFLSCMKQKQIEVKSNT